MSARTRRIAIIFAILIGLLAVTVIAADRIGAYAAETMLASESAKELSARDITSDGEPEVTVGGFPFLTQVLRGRYEKVTISVDKPRSGDIQLDRMTLVADGVRAPLETITSKQGTVTADRVSGTVDMNWDAVRNLLQLAGVDGIDPSLVEISGKDDTVELRAPFVIFGVQVTITGAGTFTVADGVVRLRLNSLEIEGEQVPAQVKRAVDAVPRSVQLRVPALPYQLSVERVATTSTGVVITAAAAQVTLTQ